MIFPIDINKKIRDKSKATAGDNQKYLIVFGFFMLNLVGFFVIGWVLTLAFGYNGFWAVIIIMLALNLTVGIGVFRFVIFDENEKIREHKEYDDDSFARYMHVRKDLNHNVTVGKMSVPVVEFDNGSAAIVVEIKFGSNDDSRAKATEEVLGNMASLAGAFSMEFRGCVSSEDILKSAEYENYVSQINSVEDVVLRNCMVEMTNAITEASRETCNANCIRITVRTLSAFQRSDIEAIVKNYCSLLATKGTAIRSARFLGIEEIKSFFCEFYGIGAIDVSMMKAVALSKEADAAYGKMVSVFSLEDKDGRTYRAVGTENKIFKLGEKKIGQVIDNF